MANITDSLSEQWKMSIIARGETLGVAMRSFPPHMLEAAIQTIISNFITQHFKPGSALYYEAVSCFRLSVYHCTTANQQVCLPTTNVAASIPTDSGQCFSYLYPSVQSNYSPPTTTGGRRDPMSQASSSVPGLESPSKVS